MDTNPTSTATINTRGTVVLLRKMAGPSLMKLPVLAFLSLSLILLVYLLSSSVPFPSSFSLVPLSTPPPPHSDTASGREEKRKNSWASRQLPVRLGLIDESGSMNADFERWGGLEFNASSLEEEQEEEMLGSNKGGNEGVGVRFRAKYGRFRVCEEGKMDYVPCMDNVDEIKRLSLSSSLERFERHCPDQGMGLVDCLVPVPKGYQKPIPWPQSRDEVWLSNIPNTRLVENKEGQNFVAIKKDKFVFPGGGTQNFHELDQYLNQISQMVPAIAFGHRTRVVLDIGCGVASFGAFLLKHNVTTLSIAPKDIRENQIQFALERGIPAMISVFAKHRLLYPSQAFDLMHCSRCGIDWTHNDGIWLLEANRVLRAGGYFVWAAQAVYKREGNLQLHWQEMQNLTSCICWELVKREGHIAIWRKPLNNTCYLGHGSGVHPLLCEPDEDPDQVWYINIKACITRLPENGYGANISMWPTRLHHPPDRLQSISMDAYLSRKELLKAESKYWNEIIDSYIGAFHWKEKSFRNVMDMRAGFGGFAAALHDLQIDCWVMNVVPVDGFNTLPVIFDRGLIGVMHDWCEPFDTYPRTYDLLHAAGLFSAERRRNKCNISTILLEMDRMLRPGGTAYIRDSLSVMDELEEVVGAMGWIYSLQDTGEGPHASWRILICEKQLP